MDRRRFLTLSTLPVIGAVSPLSSPGAVRADRTADSASERSEQRDGEGDGPIEAKVDLHAHLRLGGGQEMADRYAELGFDALVGTDHAEDVDLPGHETAEEVADYSDLDFPGPILDGVEASEDRHVNVIASENEAIKQINHPMRYGLDGEDIREFADRIGADLVEVTDHAEKLEQYPTFADVRRDLELNPTVGSDAHDVDAVGNGYVVVEVDELTGDAIIESLKAGSYSVGGQLW